MKVDVLVGAHTDTMELHALLQLWLSVVAMSKNIGVHRPPDDFLKPQAFRHCPEVHTSTYEASVIVHDTSPYFLRSFLRLSGF